MEQTDVCLSKVLIVNDSKFSLNHMASLLRQFGFQNIYTSLSAVEALRRMKSEENKLTPDLILMNLFMPNMDGIEACRRIKSMKELQDIPIIMITSTDGDEQIKKAFEAGATDFVSIPIREVEFIARVETALRLKREMDRRKAREDELRLVMKELNGLNQRLKELSYMDSLTGVYNRRYFDEALKREWNRSIRYERHLSIIMMDIDDFKLYNDRYGHYDGDDCLRKVADALKRSLRNCDTLARYGGEEFVAILPETDRDGVLKAAQRLLKNVRDLQIPHEDSETSPIVTISAGCFSIQPKAGDGIDQFVTSADRALYIAKKRGRNQAYLLDDEAQR